MENPLALREPGSVSSAPRQSRVSEPRPSEFLPRLAAGLESRAPRLASIRRSCSALAIVLSTAGSASLVAHDVWIEPTSFSPKPGDLVGARIRVGQDLIGDPLPRDPALIHQFIVDDGERRTPLIGRTGSDPAGLLRVAAPGLLVVGYASHPSTIELPAEKFSQYLDEEGLDAVAALRARRGQTGAGARERFSRCAKSLVLSGPPSAAHADRPLGLTLELVAERNPYAMAAGHDLPVRLTYESQPLAGAFVVAMNRSHPSDKLTARSDRDGRVRFRLSRTGMWMIKAVHMIPARDTQADWESFWASLTFELPGAVNAPTASR